MLPISNDEDVKNITDFFSSQTDLNKIHLVFPVRRFAGIESFLTTILLHIIRKLPKLEVLTFHSTCSIDFSIMDLTEFIATLPENLVSLDLRGIGCGFRTPPGLDLPLVDYRKLRRLRLDSDFAGSGLHSEIFSRCRSLEYLALQIIDIETSKRILRDHVRIPSVEHGVSLIN